MTNTSSSCIDLNFNLNPSLIQNLVLKYFFIWIVATIVLFFNKMILNLPPPSPYVREVWDYSKADRKNTRGEV